MTGESALSITHGWPVQFICEQFDELKLILRSQASNQRPQLFKERLTQGVDLLLVCVRGLQLPDIIWEDHDPGGERAEAPSHDLSPVTPRAAPRFAGA